VRSKVTHGIRRHGARQALHPEDGTVMVFRLFVGRALPLQVMALSGAPLHGRQSGHPPVSPTHRGRHTAQAVRGPTRLAA
jgi:hypothetical protein